MFFEKGDRVTDGFSHGTVIDPDERRSFLLSCGCCSDWEPVVNVLWDGENETEFVTEHELIIMKERSGTL